MDSQMMRWNLCEKRLAVICGIVSNEITSTMPTIRKQATIVSAMNIISMYSKACVGIPLRTGKLAVERYVYYRVQKSEKNKISSIASPPSKAMSLNVIVRMFPNR